MRMCEVFIIIVLTLFVGNVISRLRPNFVFVLTDDQDVLLNGLLPMTKTQHLIANEGLVFENAFVNSPICCPSRSSILTGKYARNVGVTNNSLSGNCSSTYWQNNFEKRTLFAYLKDYGNYTTFYAGKYLNQYGDKSAGGVAHVPYGYDWWIGLKGNSRYHNFTLSINGTGLFFKEDYLTDVLTDYTLKFIKNAKQAQPFIMMIAPPASHAPFTPAVRHKNRFRRQQVVRSPSFNYTSYDKHWIVQMPPQTLPTNINNLNAIQRGRLQTLLAVDEMIEKLDTQLREIGVQNETYFLFTSDNGFHIGQFTQPWDKRQPYETDIRVPFFIKGPHIPKKSVIRTPISAVDIAPTILDLANVVAPNDMDGISLKSDLLEPSSNDFERFVFIEYWGEGDSNSIDPTCPWKNDPNLAECSKESWCKCQDSKNNTYACLLHISVKNNFKFCHFWKENFYEAYNLKEDPYELQNVFHSMKQHTVEYYKSLLHTFK